MALARTFGRRLSGARSRDADRDLVERSGLFDAAWYLETYPDVARSGLDPLDHFLRFGGLEGRDPGPRFSSGVYRRRHPEVATEGRNPLVAWLRWGQPEHAAAPAPPPLLDDPRILYVHIPKTAGTSVYTALKWWATAARSIRFTNGGEDLEPYLALPAETIANARVIGGHLWYPDFLRRDLAGFSAVTLVRDPVARALSAYTFIREEPTHPWRDQVLAMDLDGFLDWYATIPQAVDEQCRFICGEPDAELAWTWLTTRFALAATVEQMPGFLDGLCRLVGSRLEPLERNRSQHPIDPTTLGPETLARIEALGPQDRILVERVRAAGFVGTAVGLLGLDGSAAAAPDAMPSLARG